MAGPWERYQAASAEAGPWEKFKPKAAEEWERAVLLPMETNKGTGERRLAWPQLAVDAGNALTAPGRAYRGEYGLEANPETGNVTTLTPDLVKDTVGFAALPAMGSTGGVVSTGLKQAVEGGMAPGARKALVRLLSDDQVPLKEVGPRMDALGPDAVLGDLGPRLQKATQAVATMPGPGQKTVIDALRLRAAGRNERVTGGVDETLGGAPVPSAIKAGVREGQDALSPYYQKAMEGAQRVDTSPVALDLDSAIVNKRGEAQSAAKKVRGMLNVVGTNELDPSPRTLFEVRKAIDGMLETEKDTNAIAVLSGTRKQVDELLAQSAPGIKEIDAMYAELARQKEGFDTGTQILRTGPEAPHPSDVIEQMVSGATPQGKGVGPSAVPFRLSQGARADIDRLIGTKSNDLLALKNAVGGEGDWNRAKLAAVFGQEKADKLLAIINRELRYKELEDDALGGSRTAALTAAREEIVGKEAGPRIIQSLMDIKPGTATAAGIDKGLGWIKKGRRASTNAAIGDALVSRQRELIAQQLMNGGPSALTQMAPSAVAKALLVKGDAPWNWVNPSK